MSAEENGTNDKKQLGFFDGNPRAIFVFGLVAGIALTYIGGDLIGSSSGRAVAAGDTPVVAAGDAPAAAPAAGVLAAVNDDDHVRGDLSKAKVVMIEYSDYECPFCERHHPTMQEIYSKYGDDIAWVYRHFPLSFHPEAVPAANAAECANEQGKFWEYTDALYENQDKLGTAYYGELADELKLKRSQFDDCVESEKYAAKIAADTASGRTAGVTGTPATFINGKMISGAVPTATITALIDAALK